MIGSVSGNAASFAYYPTWLRVTCKCSPSILINAVVAIYCRINVHLRQELALSGSST